MHTSLSANQLWKSQVKNGHTTLNFLPWLQREKAKAFHSFDGTVAVPFNKALNDSIQSAITDLHTQGGLKTKAGEDYVMGISRVGFVKVTLVVTVLTGAILIYINSKR